MKAELVQAAIAAFSLSTIILALDENERVRRVAPFIGLVGQIPWLYFALRSDAWGIALTAIAFTIVYLNAAVRSVHAWRRRR